jgi:hypothetical protein
MTARQLLRVALVFLGLLVLWGAAALARRHGGAPGAGERFPLPPIGRGAVDTVVIAGPADTTLLARKDSSTWTANGFPAAPQAVSDLLGALGDTSSGSELVAERRASHAGLGVDSANGTRVRVKGGGRTLADLIVGHRSPDFSGGGYARLADQERTYLVRGRLVDLLTRSADEWRDHRIAAVPTDSIGAIEVSRGGRRYELRRTASGWTLSPGGAADTSRASELAAAYRTVQASGFATKAQADSARFTPPGRRTRVLRKDGSPILTLLFDSTASGVWVRSDTGKTIYRVEAYEADQLAPPDTSLRAKPAKGGR